MVRKISHVAFKPSCEIARLNTGKTRGFIQKAKLDKRSGARSSGCSGPDERLGHQRPIGALTHGSSVNVVAGPDSTAMAALVAFILVIGGSAPLGADERATKMWGTGSSASSSKDSQLASSKMHVNYGVVAGQVNAARDGLLYQGTSITLTSIGSQNVISTTIFGDNNRLDVDAEQDSSNSGDVTNNGTINVQRRALRN